MDVRERFVWPVAVRLVHWVLVAAIVVLAATGWIMGSGMVLSDDLYQVLRQSFHVPAGQTVGIALAGRLLLLAADPGVSGWKALMPTRESFPAMIGMLKFYISWGKNKLPGYFAHDPLWAVLYLPFFLLLLLQTIGGLALEYEGVRRLIGFEPAAIREWHGSGAFLILLLAGLHVASVILREVRGTGYEVSAMLHGHRIFRVDRNEAMGFKQEVKIDLSTITKPKPRDE